MKRIFALIIALLMFVVVFTGCGGDSGDSDSNDDVKSTVTIDTEDVSLKDVVDSINEAYPDDTKDVTEITDVKDLNKYYNINVDDVKQFAAEVDKKDSSIEIVIVEAVDSDAADSVKSKLDIKYNQLRSNGASYNEEQLEMVNNCEVTTNGNFVIYIISEQYDGMVDIVNKAIG